MAAPTVRLYEPGDEVAINEAFNRVFGKRRSLQEWAWKYATDAGPKSIVAAWDGALLAAHNGGIPADFEVDGVRFKALQGADTLALAAAEKRPEWRDAWRQVMDLFAELARDRFGVSLLYGFTGGQAISHMVHRARWDSVPPRRIPLLVRDKRPSGRSLVSRFFSARLADDHEPALDLLWERVRHRYAAAVVRDAAYASRRLAGHPTVRYHRFLVTPRLSPAPVAFVAFRTDGGVCRWV
ncbi:MAG: GNAT family N-acetyltransferase, partial [Acidobacteriota bacterium]